MLAMDGITRWLELNGFVRASTVREPGDYAVRGGIIDLYPPGMAEPVRLDFFGDTLETIRSFDPESQRTTDQLRALDLVPVAEFQLTTETIRRFRLGYVEAFGAARARRPALPRGERRAAAIPAWSTGCRCFTTGSTRCSTTCRVRRSCSSRSPRTPRASGLGRSRTITTRGSRRYAARIGAALQAAAAGPALSWPKPNGASGSEAWRSARLTPFAVPEGQGPVIDAGTKQGRNFAGRAGRGRAATCSKR